MTRFFRAPDGQEVPGGSRAATGGVRWTGPSADQKCNAPTAFGKVRCLEKVAVGSGCTVVRATQASEGSIKRAELL